MGAYDGYYLYCDLDGTLLDSDKRISDENRAAIHSFVEQGGRFGVATGRVPGIIGAAENELPINAPCILGNGAGLYDLSSRKYLSTHPVDRTLCAQLAQRVMELQRDICVQIFTDDAIYELNPLQRDDPQTIIERIPTTFSAIENVPGSFLKVLLAHTPEALDLLFPALDLPQLCPGLSAFRTADWYLEVVATGVNKGSMLQEVRARCDNVQTILAIGDYNNDLEMVSLADIGGAPANAIDEIKATADIVLAADNNHSCVARFLEAAVGLR